MARTVDDLPDEILVEVLMHLGSSALKNARRSCRRWARAGARWLFRRIYFAPHKEIMDVFAYVTSEPAFAVGVTELVYDARMFWKYRAQTYAYVDAYANELTTLTKHQLGRIVGGRPSEPYQNGFPNHREYYSSFNRYKMLLRQQEVVLDAGQDFQLLCRGLRNLPNLRTISIDDFCGHGTRCDLHKPLSRWYQDWSETLWKGVVRPTSWNLSLTLMNEAEQEVPDSDGEYRLKAALVVYPWDWRGIANCLRAVSLCCPLLTHLYVGTQSSKIPLYLLDNPEFTASLGKIVKTLQCFQFQTSLEISAQDENLGADAAAGAVFKFEDILGEAQQLKTLSLSVSEEMGPSTLQRTFKHTQWPCLTTLDLGYTDSDLVTLTSVCYRHKDTLMHLKLRNVSLTHPDKTETWQDVATDLGGFLKLQSVTLCSLWSHENHNYMDGVGLSWVAYNMLRWAPRGLLELEEETGMVVLRHR